MTEFLVSARKYRPQTFTELVSQDHVAETLRNAIKLDRLAHAYLFCGPRGVGKTSAARILAKMVNCSTPLEERENLDPCRTCDSCVSFEEGRSLNVIEIDAASNNSVEDVRALRETVRVPPQSGVKKVYIIDEVHMLSKQAFNALLKTLEEPPSYVQFLFATTEPQKVIPTILSRCQRFDFRRIAIPDIVERLKAICVEEGIEADEASLRLIARKGDGALRDAFSTFDQAVLLCGDRLEYPVLVQALGTVDVDVYFETASLIAGRDRAGLLKLVERLVSKGYDINEFLLGLTDHLRNLLVAVTTRSTDLIEADEETAGRYLEQSALFHEADVLRHLIVVDEAQEILKRSVKPRLRLELALLKMASLARSTDLQQLLQQLGGKGSTQGDSPAEGTRSSGPMAGAPLISEPSSTEVKGSRGESKSSATATPSTSSTAGPSSPSSRSAVAPSSRSTERSPTSSSTSASPEVAESGEVIPEPPPAPARPAGDASRGSQPTAANPTEGFFGAPAISTPPGSGSPAVKSADASSARTGTASEESGAIVAFSEVETAWDGYIKAVMKDRIHVGALLQHAVPSSVVGTTVEIAVPDDFHERLLGSETAYLADKLATTLSLNPAPSVRVVISETDTMPETTPEMDAGERIQKLKEQNPIIAALIEKFGGEVVW